MNKMWLSTPIEWPQDVQIDLPLSKSVSNRVLILHALSGGLIQSNDYSSAKDSVILEKILQLPESVVMDVEDAGTPLRFLLAYAATLKQSITITGTKRMQERPIQGLCDALLELGAGIEYLGNKGFPPVKITPPKKGLVGINPVTISDKRSSQFISALMLIAPLVKDGLRIKFPEDFPSYAYITLTADIMKQAGLIVFNRPNEVYIPEQNFRSAKISSEADWSGASYFFSLFALGEWSSLTLKNLSLDSIQNDKKIVDYMTLFGIKATPHENDLILSKVQKKDTNISLDFKDNPDLAMTVLVTLALSGKNATIYGLENLEYKESNRVSALQSELKKINVNLESNKDFWTLNSDNLSIPEEVEIDSHDDHRIAMSFSPLAIYCKLTIDKPSVVSKSFPNYWLQLEKLKLNSHKITHDGKD